MMTMMMKMMTIKFYSYMALHHVVNALGTLREFNVMMITYTKVLDVVVSKEQNENKPFCLQIIKNPG